jgi:hypothetical protein
MIGLLTLGNGFRLACAGHLDVYSQLAQTRDWLDAPGAPRQVGRQPAARDTPLGAISEPLAMPRTLGAGAVSSLLQAKQSDAFAYRAHAALAQVLEHTPCGRAAIRAQWLKAGLHARGENQVTTTVDGLQRGVVHDRDRTELRDEIDMLHQAEYWSTGLRSVEVALFGSAVP